MLNEYKETMIALNNAEKNYLDARREYDEIEFDLLVNFNFKSVYGKDNEKIRKQHMRKEYPDLCEKKDILKLDVEELKRKLKYLELCIEYGGDGVGE